MLATMVYAVSLDLKVKDFRYVARHPVAVGIGLVAQFVLLPLATLGVTLLLDLSPEVEAAMLLVSACSAEKFEADDEDMMYSLDA